MTRGGTRWCASTAGPTASAARVARALRSPVTAGTMRAAAPPALPHRCAGCGARFDDLTGTVLAGHHQPLRMWVLCLYLMGLNLSNRQIAQELGLDASDVQAMTEHLRQGLVARAPVAKLDDTAEIDEVYIVAGHKGQPAEVVKRGAQDGVAGFQVRRDAARWKRRNHQFSG